jgi:hypothetical protein
VFFNTSFFYFYWGYFDRFGVFGTWFTVFGGFLSAILGILIYVWTFSSVFAAALEVFGAIGIFGVSFFVLDVFSIVFGLIDVSSVFYRVF